jgi:hypothetical protein
VRCYRMIVGWHGSGARPAFYCTLNLIRWTRNWSSLNCIRGAHIRCNHSVMSGCVDTCCGTHQASHSIGTGDLSREVKNDRSCILVVLCDFVACAGATLPFWRVFCLVVPSEPLVHSLHRRNLGRGGWQGGKCPQYVFNLGIVYLVSELNYGK